VENPKFLAGSEKEFFNFISNLTEKDKIALITHNDLDGVISAKIVNECINVNFIEFIDYKDINEKLMKKIKLKKINKVIITDIGINETNIKKIEKFSEVLIIDHHNFNFDFNSNKTSFINTDGFCASYSCYYLFSKIQNIDFYDWLVACACISDFMEKNVPEFMSKTFKKYNENFSDNETAIQNTEILKIQKELSLSLIYFEKNIKKVYESIGKKFGEIGNLSKYHKIINEEINKKVKEFYKKREIFNNIYFLELKSKYNILSMLINELSMNEKNKVFIIISKYSKVYQISARNQEGDIDLPNLLKMLVNKFKNSGAGGHFHAAGGFFPVKYLPEFKKRLINISKRL